MNDLVTELAAQGLSLPPEERVRLLDLLLASLTEGSGSEVDAAWCAEIERRVRAHERGESKLHDVENVMAEAVRIAP